MSSRLNPDAPVFHRDDVLRAYMDWFEVVSKRFHDANNDIVGPTTATKLLELERTLASAAAALNRCLNLKEAWRR